MYNKFFGVFRDSNPPSTKEIPDTIVNSGSIAKTCHNKEILPDHLIMAMINAENQTAATDYLKNCKDCDLIEKFLIDQCMTRKVNTPIGLVAMSAEGKEAVEGAESMAQELGAEKLRAEHILLSILKRHDYPFSELEFERVKTYFRDSKR